MDDDLPRPVDPPEPVPGAARGAVVPPLPTLPDEISAKAEEVRRMIDAGASTPEELRALAARIRDQRALEESVWRAEVKPALIQAKKGKFTLRDLRDPVEEQQRTPHGMQLGLILLVVVGALVLAAAQSSFLWILVPVVVVLVVAYRQGRAEHTSAGAPSAGGAASPGDSSLPGDPSSAGDPSSTQDPSV